MTTHPQHPSDYNEMGMLASTDWIGIETADTDSTNILWAPTPCASQPEAPKTLDKLI